MSIAKINWDDAFSNARYIDKGEDYPDLWARRAADYRSSAFTIPDVPYGYHRRERMDIFRPDGEPIGLAVFVHGGYWSEFDKSSWSDLAAGAVSLGWAVVIPSYTLAPEARIRDITRQVGHAIEGASEKFDGPVRLAGHSAGGHLVTRMICDDTPLPPGVLSRIDRVLSISGLHDLRPLRLTEMNVLLKLDQKEAEIESPVLHDPVAGPELTCWVGDDERPEFVRQSRCLAEVWASKGLPTSFVQDRGRHHFDVIDGLKVPYHPLARTFAGDHHEAVEH
ncbi:alpha/beta hydrolase [Hoeflea poritis]|uniref:Alpha/beta hydrolase n=1 Tax=Hoeflea poritis TaxID=2993659 RepID=A0ABT4VWW6_9HYPH|nr:alpha/beta hydrolase [Hoeflea poritis]MDA4848498.1 alpha/beta hydrolase [Hoeflea poritis]